MFAAITKNDVQKLLEEKDAENTKKGRSWRQIYL